MAITENTFNGDGSNLGPFSFTFPWLESGDIKVSVNGINKTAGTHYNLQNLNYATRSGGQVLFIAGNAPPVGTNNIRIYRETDDTSLSATFNPGSAIRSQDLNDNFTQALYVAQETKVFAEATDASAIAATANQALSTAQQANTTAQQALAATSFPAGTVIYHAASTPPSGWLKADGALVSRTTYANLFAVIGTLYGAGDGSTTFALPDLRGEFLRGWDDGRGVDSGRSFGSSQSHALESHTHTYNFRQASVSSGASSLTATSNTTLTFNTGANTGNSASETRPRNIALLACIKT